jgi:hypothetical protein
MVSRSPLISSGAIVPSDWVAAPGCGHACMIVSVIASVVTVLMTSMIRYRYRATATDCCDDRFQHMNRFSYVLARR